MEIYLQDSAATEALGRLLGKHAASGDVFCLSGDLGAGKTLLSRGVAVALGAAAEDVNSPNGLSCSRRSYRRNICRLHCCMMVKAVVLCCRLRVKDTKNCCRR